MRFVHAPETLLESTHIAQGREQYAGVNTFRADRMAELAMHPTVKPTALVADAIRDVTRRGDLVLDPFAGSGTTIIAAEKTGRNARAIEFDPLYCDVIVRRWERYTGKAARLEEGRSSRTSRRSASLQAPHAFVVKPCVNKAIAPSFAAIASEINFIIAPRVQVMPDHSMMLA